MAAASIAPQARPPGPAGTAGPGHCAASRDPRALDPLLAAPAGGSGVRVIGKHGISVDNAIYIAPELGARVGQRVQVRQDPADPGMIHVFTADGTFLCTAQDIRGADQLRIAAEARQAARDADQTERAAARDRAHKHHPGGAMDDVLTAADRAASNVIALPLPGQPHETPALHQAGLAAETARRTPPLRGGGQMNTMEAAARLLLDEEEN